MRLYEIPIAHRGLHDEESTENSMSAFQKALDCGYNIETDVHLLTDGKIAVFHDAKLDRVLPAHAGTKISDLSSKDLAGDKYLLPCGEHIPLFEDMLKLVDGKVDILCELKNMNFFSFKLERAVYKMIKDKPWVKVQSFSPFSMLWFRHHAKEIIRGQLSANLPWARFNGIAHVKGRYPLLNLVKPDFFAYDILNLPSEAVTKACQNHKMKLLSWTVKTDELKERAKTAGVDNIIFENIRPEI